MKKLLLTFEKKITENQKLRIKFADEPERFMESEFALHREITNLHVIAASPELYPILLQTKSLTSILGMITHENTDISIAAISLLQELTDADTIKEDPDSTTPFIDAMIAASALELLVQNLFRMNESNAEDAQGVYDTLAIFENLLELRPTDLADQLGKRTHILRYLLDRVKTKVFDDNKFYATEILSQLLQSSEENRRRIGSMTELDGLDTILQAIAIYRKRPLDRVDEQECVENLFLCLCSALMIPSNQAHFLAAEGFELMIKCLSEQQYAAGCTFQVLSYAVTKYRAGCERLIEVGGLKHIFPVLVGKGLKKALKKTSSGEKRNIEESVISIIAQLCLQLHGSSASNHDENCQRLAMKFVDHDYEKLNACVELFSKYKRNLAKTEEEIEATRRELQRSGADEEELAEFEDEDYLLAQRLDGGLFVLQQLSVIMVFVCIMYRSCVSLLHSKLMDSEVDPAEVLDILRDMILTLREGIEQKQQQQQVENGQQSEDDQRQVELLTQWTAIYAALLESP